MVPRCRDREGAYLEILPNKPQPGVRISIMPNLPRSGLNAFPAVVMHPQLTREGRSHPSSLQLPSLSLPSPNTHRTSSELSTSWQGLPPGGSRQSEGRVRAAGPSGLRSLGVCKSIPRWQQQLRLPLPRPQAHPARLPALGDGGSPSSLLH